MIFKRGDTLSLAGRAQPIQGGYAGWSLTAQVRVLRANAPAEKIADLTATWTDAGSGALLLYHANTSAWPLGDAVFDVRYTAPDGARKTTDDYVRFKIIDAATPGTQLPASTTLLSPFTAWRTNNATALAVGLDIMEFAYQQGY